ncbi:MAG: hypothetical protein RIC87_02245 [Kiloniellales bacterium]
MPHSLLLADCRTDNLKLSEQLLLWSLRSWVQATREGHCPLCAIQEPFALIGAEPVAEALHRTFLLLLRPSDRGLRFHFPRCCTIAEDESRLLLAAGAAHHGEEQMACRLLSGSFERSTAEALAQALRALGVLLSRHGLPLPQRLPPVMRLAVPLSDASSVGEGMRLH